MRRRPCDLQSPATVVRAYWLVERAICPNLSSAVPELADYMVPCERTEHQS